MKTLNLISLGLLLFPCTLFSADFYWVKNTGNWSDYSVHWATSSGGNQFHTRPPGPFDNVLIDQNSFSQSNDSIILDIDASVKNINFSTGVKTNLVGEKNLTVFGNLKFDSVEVYIPHPGGIHLEGTDSIHTFDHGTQTIRTELHFLGKPTAYYLQRKLELYGGIHLNDASLFTNSFDVSAWFLVGQSVSNLHLGNSIVFLGFAHGGGSLRGVYIYGGTSHIFASRIESVNGHFHDVSLHPYTHSPTITFGNKASYEHIYVETTNTFRFDSGEKTVLGNLTILDGGIGLGSGIQNLSSLKILGPSESLIIEEGVGGVEHNLNGYLYLNPDASGITTLKSLFPGTTGTLNTYLNDSVCYNNLRVQDLNITGYSTFIARNSIDRGNTQGITFDTCSNIHRVGLAKSTVPTFGNCVIGDTINDRLTIEAYHSAGSATKASTYKMPIHGKLIDLKNGSYGYIRQSTGADTISMEVLHKFGTRTVADTVHWVITDTVSNPGLTVLEMETKHGNIEANPNPIVDFVVFNDLVVESKLTIYDATGKIVEELKVYNQRLELDLSHLPRGFYSVSIQEKNNVRSTKLIKQ